MTQDVTPLPAHSLVRPLNEAITSGNVIVGAPPGAGKSTVLPLAVLNQLKGKVLLMQPRRVVVRNLASYLASQCGERVGETVGYRIRGENRTSAHTRLEVITEGILARLIQDDPELNGISAIIFDEFHERSIHSDFGLALALDVQAGLRDDLRLVVMSATLELAPLQALLPDARVLTSDGRSYPVDIRYGKDTPASDVVPQVLSTLRQAMATHKGDILVFLPGQGSIHKLSSQLDGLLSSDNDIVHTLYGALPKGQQDAAIRPDPEGHRKIILATNIAETSLTIDGITVVIDSGLENVASFNPTSGLTALKQVRISQASAQQRAGRAGRLSAGHCYRLWSQVTHERLAEHALPQISRADLSPLMLDTLNWGCDISELRMLTPPDNAQVEAALNLLQQLQAVDADQRITSLGRAIAEIPCHPRLAAMLRQAARMDSHAVHQAAPWVVALAEDGSRINRDYVTEAFAAMDKATVKRLSMQAKRYARWCHSRIAETPIDLESDAVAACIALAYPDRIAYRRGDSYKLAGGKGARIALSSPPQWLAVLHGQDAGSDVTIRLAQPISQPLLATLFPDAFGQRDVVRYNPQRQAMEARRVTGFDAIDITSEPIGCVANEHWAAAWFDYLNQRDVADWPLAEETWQWWWRVSLARQCDIPVDDHGQSLQWPSSLGEVITLAKDRLTTKLAHCRSRRDVETLPWTSLLHQSLAWPLQQALATHLPDKIATPGGRLHALQYRSDGQVVLAVRMQEMFGQVTPVTLAGGRVTVTLELLSPAQRPLQTTSDPGRFWAGSYRDIQKEMKGRYPKHFWPDDPTTAPPTTRTKKAMD